MADYEQDQCRLYIAAGRLLEDPDTTLTVGKGRHNVAKDFRSIIAHEIGHLVMPKFEDQIREKFRIIYDSQPKEYWEKAVSTYAGTDDHELFGESFAAWTHPDYVEGMLPAIIEDVMRGVDMMKFDWPKLRKFDPTDGSDDNGHSNNYNDRNDQGDVTITTSTGTVFTSDMIETILDSVGDADWVVLTGTISPALRQAFADAGYSELVAAGAGTDSKMFGVSADAAEKYAAAHSADLVTGITDTTRKLLRGTIEDAVKEGWDRYELADEIENNFAFGEYRSGLIAKNELALAYGRGRYGAAKDAGAIGKRWLLSSDHDPKEDCSCSDAADAGVVDLDESFVEGDDDYFVSPSHVNCCCETEYVYSEDDSDDDDSDADKMAKYESTFDETMEWLNSLTENQWVPAELEKFDQNTDAGQSTDYQDEIEDEDVVNDIPPDDELKAGEEANALCAALLPAASQGDTVGLRMTGRAIAHTANACATFGVSRASEHRTARDLHFEAEKHYRNEKDNVPAADAHQAVAEKHIEILRMIESAEKYDECDLDFVVDELQKRDVSDEDRDDHGRWTAGGGSDFKHDGKHWTGGTAVENARLNALKVPPAWKNVRLNPDAHGDKQAMGVDSKGRTQAIYSADFRAGQDAAKFERLKEFNQVVPKAVDQLRSDMNNTKLDAATRDAAAATYLISQTGIRIGSNKETGAAKQAYGASTLQGRHVKVNGDTISLNFTGKKGVEQKIKFQDADLASYLKAKGAQRSTPVFGATTDAHIRDYFHKTIGDQFVVKDFRTWTGTATALRTVATLKAPTSEKDYKKAVKTVAKVVSEKLGNTPAIALKSYIDPTVFKSWSKSFKAAA